MTARPFLLMRRDLRVPVVATPVPAGYRIRTLEDGDERPAHMLLSRTYGEAGDALPPLEQWWSELSGDEEFSPALCFLAVDGTGDVAGIAQCWIGSFLKDLAVRKEARRLGLGEALLTHCFAAFQRRGAAHLDLKVEVDNPTGALRLYERCGMTVAA